MNSHKPQGKKDNPGQVIRKTAVAICLGLVSATSAAQSNDVPDLQGFWTNASRTSLSRPRGVDELDRPRV